ncbi:MAG TPA: STAS domain-containing protein [Candidatus Baltobacteraceae bacterium]|nr:STAS domain-containing protein [Candidatus Baltobacteraceae bacterium]
MSARVAVLNGGEYDVFRREDLRAELDSIEVQGDVDLDLRETTFIDAGAAGLLVSFRNRVRNRYPKAHVRLVNVPPIVRRLLQVSGTAEAFEIVS